MASVDHRGYDNLWSLVTHTLMTKNKWVLPVHLGLGSHEGKHLSAPGCQMPQVCSWILPDSSTHPAPYLEGSRLIVTKHLDSHSLSWENKTQTPACSMEMSLATAAASPPQRLLVCWNRCFFSRTLPKGPAHCRGCTWLLQSGTLLIKQTGQG